MKTNLLLIFFFLSFSARAFTITSLNVEWFGRGGVITGSTVDEYRGDRIRDFLLNQIPVSDVIVFQEITSPDFLQKTFPEYECLTYPFRERHQHVVLCSKLEYETSFFEVKEVALGSKGLRPASAITISLKGKNAPDINIIGLHLKAGRLDSSIRLKQIQELAKSEYLEENVVIIGDFNTYPIESTEGEIDDEVLINQVLSPLGLTQAQYEGGTFLNRSLRRFDHAWTKGVTVKSTKVYGPCRFESVGFPYSDFGFYNRFVSDHCALQLEI